MTRRCAARSTSCPGETELTLVLAGPPRRRRVSPRPTPTMIHGFFGDCRDRERTSSGRTCDVDVAAVPAAHAERVATRARCGSRFDGVRHAGAVHDRRQPTAACCLRRSSCKRGVLRDRRAPRRARRPLRGAGRRDDPARNARVRSDARRNACRHARGGRPRRPHAAMGHGSAGRGRGIVLRPRKTTRMPTAWPEGAPRRRDDVRAARARARPLRSQGAVGRSRSSPRSTSPARASGRCASAYNKGRWRINDRVFEMGETPVEVARDTTEAWLLRNYHTSMPHAMHLHGFHYATCWSARPRPIRSPRSPSTSAARLPSDLGRKDTRARLAGRERARGDRLRAAVARRADVHVPLPQPRARGRRDDGGRARRVTRAAARRRRPHARRGAAALRRGARAGRRARPRLAGAGSRSIPACCPGSSPATTRTTRRTIDLEPLARRAARADRAATASSARRRPAASRRLADGERRSTFDVASLDVGSLRRHVAIRRTRSTRSA